ncbi:MAG: hypothetical protein AB7F19_00760 [Candidatus Babeliales bacterium]
MNNKFFAALIICAIATQVECSVKNRIAQANSAIANIKQNIKADHASDVSGSHPINVVPVCDLEGCNGCGGGD